MNMQNRVSSLERLRHVAFDGALGATFGLLVVFVLAASSMGVRQALSGGPELLSWLALVVFVIVGQFAIAAGLCGFAIRRIEGRS
jgi:hypothetical protein